MDPVIDSHVLRHRREPDSRTTGADLPLDAQIGAAQNHRAPNNLVVHINDVVIANQLIHRPMLRLREPIRLNHQRRRTHTRQVGLNHRRRSPSRSGSGGLGSSSGLLSRSGSRIGLSLSLGGLSLSRFQGRLELGDDRGVYCPLSFGQSRIESCLGLGGGGSSSVGLSLGRIGLGLGGGGSSLSRGDVGLSGRLSRGGVGSSAVIVLVVAAGGGHQPEDQHHRGQAHPGSLLHVAILLGGHEWIGALAAPTPEKL